MLQEQLGLLGTGCPSIDGGGALWHEKEAQPRWCLALLAGEESVAKSRQPKHGQPTERGGDRVKRGSLEPAGTLRWSLEPAGTQKRH